jgi:hypothetical protein
VRKKCEAPVKPGFCVFTGVFEGCFGESAFVAVVFAGVNVVECVVNVELEHRFGTARKVRHRFQLYF